MTPDQVHMAHRELKRLEAYHKVKVKLNRLPLDSVTFEFREAEGTSIAKLPLGDTEALDFTNNQISRIEDRLRKIGVAV